MGRGWRNMITGRECKTHNWGCGITPIRWQIEAEGGALIVMLTTIRIRFIDVDGLESMDENGGESACADCQIHHHPREPHDDDDPQDGFPGNKLPQRYDGDASGPGSGKPNDQFMYDQNGRLINRVEDPGHGKDIYSLGRVR